MQKILFSPNQISLASNHKKLSTEDLVELALSNLKNQLLRSFIRKENFCPATSLAAAPMSVTLKGPPLDSETGWSGKLRSKTNLLKLREKHFFW